MFGNNTPDIETSDDNTWRRSCEHFGEEDVENADVYDMAYNTNAREKLITMLLQYL